MDEMGAATGERSGPRAGEHPSGRRPRRWIAFFSSLMVPGLGQLAIGYPRRMVAWFSPVAVISAVMVLFARAGSARFVPLGLTLIVVLRVGAAVDTLLLRRPADLPRAGHVWLMVIGLFAFSQLAAFNVRHYVVEAFQMPSGSMYPTLQVGDHLFVNKASHDWARGDVVVFKYPLDPQIDYLKRIVGVPGDVVEMRDGQLVINGVPAPLTRTQEPCRASDSGEPCTIWEEELGDHRYRISRMDAPNRGRDFDRTMVPPGHYFVLGDNRDNSSDSRVWGFVADELVRAKASVIWWSRDAAGFHWDRVNRPVN